MLRLLSCRAARCLRPYRQTDPCRNECASVCRHRTSRSQKNRQSTLLAAKDEEPQPMTEASRLRKSEKTHETRDGEEYVYVKMKGREMAGEGEECIIPWSPVSDPSSWRLNSSAASCISCSCFSETRETSPTRLRAPQTAVGSGRGRGWPRTTSESLHALSQAPSTFPWLAVEQGSLG